MDMCSAPPVGGITEGQLLVFLHCTKTGLNGRSYDNQNTYSFLVSVSGLQHAFEMVCRTISCPEGFAFPDR